MSDLDELRAKAEQGDAKAQLDLGLRYQRENRDGYFPPQGVEWLRKAAEQGLSEAQYQFGLVFQFGLGVEKSCGEAVNWLSKAGAQGHEPALIQLGFMYRTGEDLPRDSEEAARCWRKAAEAGSAAAQYDLGMLCAEGKRSEDQVEAVKWLRMAADQAHDAAQYALAGMYAEGRGLEKDDAEARKWFRKAADNGYGAAHSALARYRKLDHRRAREQSAPPGQDLGALIKADPHDLRILQIHRVEAGDMSLHLVVRLARRSQPSETSVIVCINAADYAIRPKNPATIEGGPLIEFHEKHSLLETPHLQSVPGGDGEVFRPPLDLKLLILDQSHVIAERFELKKHIEARVSRQ